MTADDARSRVQPIRDAARRALRALSGPTPDWAAATRAMPISARPMVPMVPQEVPVASEVIEQIITAAIRKIEGDSSLRP